MDISADIDVNVMTSLIGSELGLNAASTTTGDAAAPTSQNGIQSLLSDAQSLIDSLYPSTSVTNVAALTWPSTVVIGSQTFTITPSAASGSTFATSVSSSQSPSSAIASTTAEASPAATSSVLSAAPSSNVSSAGDISSKSRDPWDRRLGIILGVVLGAIAVALFVFLVWFLHRRRKRTGAFFKRRPSSPSDEEVFTWRGAEAGEKYSVLGENAPTQPPMAAHGLFASRSWTRNDEGHPAYVNTAYEGPHELAAERSAPTSLHEAAESEQISHRPSTPFSPSDFAAMARSPVSPIERETEYPSQRRRSSGFWPAPRAEGYTNPNASDRLEHSPSLAALAAKVGQDYHHPYYQNPFASHEDYDDDDDEYDIANQGTEAPHVPTRSPKRMSSPMVHYPTGDELGRFDFGLEEEGQRRSNSNAGRWRDV